MKTIGQTKDNGYDKIYAKIIKICTLYEKKSVWQILIKCLYMETPIHKSGVKI